MSSTARRLAPLKYAAVGLALLIALLPFYWMALTALRDDKTIYSKSAGLLPTQLTLAQFTTLWFQTPFPLYLRNSLFVALATTASTVLISILAAYAVVRLPFRGRGLFTRGVLITYLVPPTLLFIPLFSVLRNLGLYDKLGGLILTYHTFTVPFCVWMLMSYFRSIPVEMEEAALVDGCGRLGTLWRILVPTAAPGIAAAGIFSFTLAWNEFLYALVFTNREATRTIPVGITGFMLGDVYFWGQIMAMAVIATVPAAVLYFVAESYITEGLTAGGVKG